MSVSDLEKPTRTSLKDFFASASSAVDQMASMVSLKKHDRFLKYRRALEEAAQFQDRISIDWDRDEATWRRFSEALTQCQHLIDSRPLWSGWDRDCLVAALRKVRKGSAMPEDQDGDADEPRNTLLELATAARLAECSFSTQITRNGADIVARHPAVRDLVVECKRPQSPDSLMSNLWDARAQVLLRTGKSGVAHGMIAVGLDRMLGLTSSGSIIVRTDSALDAAIAGVQETLRRFLQHSFSSRRNEFFPEVPLVAFVLSIAVFAVDEQKLLTPKMFILVVTVPDEDQRGASYRELLAGLGFREG